MCTGLVFLRLYRRCKEREKDKTEKEEVITWKKGHYLEKSFTLRGMTKRQKKNVML